MGTIFKVAYFRVCSKCHKHGSIVLSNGRQSFDVASKEMGLEAVKIFRDNGHFSSDEALVMSEQIENSQLDQEISPRDARWFDCEEEDGPSSKATDCVGDGQPDITHGFGMMLLSREFQ